MRAPPPTKTAPGFAQLHGSRQTGSGKAAGSFDGGTVVLGTCPSGADGCDILQLEYNAKDDQLTVLASDEPRMFVRKG